VSGIAIRVSWEESENSFASLGGVLILSSAPPCCLMPFSSKRGMPVQEGDTESSLAHPARAPASMLYPSMACSQWPRRAPTAVRAASCGGRRSRWLESALVHTNTTFLQVYASTPVVNICEVVTMVGGKVSSSMKPLQGDCLLEEHAHCRGRNDPRTPPQGGARTPPALAVGRFTGLEVIDTAGVSH
jgi:hypothetical protein